MPDESGLPERRVEDFRLRALERELENIRRQLEDGLKLVRSDIAQLQFVRADVYAVEKSGFIERIESIDAKADASKALAMWALGLLVSAVVVAIIAIGIRVAGA